MQEGYGTRTGIRVWKVLGSKTWSGEYFVVLASRVAMNVFAKLTSPMSAAFNWSRRRFARLPRPSRLFRGLRSGTASSGAGGIAATVFRNSWCKVGGFMH